jgi:hypothetical protein
MLLLALAIGSATQWFRVANDPGVSVYVATQDTESDPKLQTFKTWVRFTYHNASSGQPSEAMTLVTFDCAKNTARTWTMIESYPNAPAVVTHPSDGPQVIAPSTYYESVRDAVCEVVRAEKEGAMVPGEVVDMTGFKVEPAPSEKAQPAAVAEWLKVGSARNEVVYIEPRSVRMEGAYKVAWSKTVYSSGALRESKSLTLYDCQGQRTALRSAVEYKRDGTNQSADWADYELTWHAVVPESIGEGLFDAVCR